MHALVLTLFFAFQAPNSEQKAPELFPFTEELETVYDSAFEAAHGATPADAAPAIERLLKEAAGNPRVSRLAGRYYFTLENFADAVKYLNLALEQGIDGPRRADVLSTLGAIRIQQEQLAEAQPLLNRALQQWPDDFQAHQQLWILHMKRGQGDVALKHARRMVELAPGAPMSQLALGAALAETEAPDEAMEAVDRARELGAAPSPFITAIEEAVSRQLWMRRAWQVPLGMALFLGVALLFSWGAGLVLSKVQLGQLQSDNLHLLRAEQTSQERWVDRFYGAVLWFASLLFYVSVPMLLLLTVSIAGGVLLLVFMLPAIPVKLIVVIGVIGFGGLFAILRGLFTSPEQGEEGRELAVSEAPALFKALEEVADVAKSRKVDRVLVDAGTGIGVRETGGRFRVLMGRGERILHLGLGAMRGLTVTELKSILAHEYGHFSHGETRLTPIISRIQTQVIQVIQSIFSMGGGNLNPVGWFLRAYFFVYLRITAGHGRRRELLADRVSALAYGGDAFGAALSKVVENSAAYDRGIVVALRLREAGRPTKDLFRTVDTVALNTPPVLQSLIREELFSRPVDAYDSHPPPTERVARVAGIPGQRPEEREPALSLFADPAALAAELGGKVLEELDSTLLERGYQAPAPVAVTDEERDRLAGAIVLQSSAFDLKERNHADAYALLQESLVQLEQAAGAQDPYLVPQLVELSRLHAQHDAPEAARRVLQRAIDIVQAQPGHEQQQVDALNELLSGIPVQQAA
ncbi:tetratricopeptide repeat protein [Myxococcus sp. SDU36]|uniref:tetratricopeptide repeat protein n=1 Tax=Myxococcus sp. SDU36 TaxID=2831967 RepID=UPI0025438E29|nr:tetratricopeptide repeat protein [Myxococcus sp. SDU36]WIG92755.1 M48 family metalloprotease [Myxococcus sp. SDU36]